MHPVDNGVMRAQRRSPREGVFIADANGFREAGERHRRKRERVSRCCLRPRIPREEVVPFALRMIHAHVVLIPVLSARRSRDQVVCQSRGGRQRIGVD